MILNEVIKMTDIEDMLKDIYFFDGIIEIDVKELFYKNGNLIPKEGFRHPKNGKFKAYTKQEIGSEVI